MRKREKIFVCVAVPLILSVVPFVFSSGYVNLAKLPFLNSNVTSSSSPTIFVDPSEIVDETLQAGSKFVVRVNVSDMLDLFTWHVKISWDNAILNVSETTYGEFLARTESPSGTSSDVANITGVFNDVGYAWAAETILGEYSGINGNGSLVSIEFLVVGYGSTSLNINITDPLETTLINSTDSKIAFTTVDGYFRNKIQGDANGDGTVDIFDIGTISAHWYPGPPVGPLGYDREADFNLDEAVDIFDIGITSANWGSSI